MRKFNKIIALLLVVCLSFAMTNAEAEAKQNEEINKGFVEKNVYYDGVECTIKMNEDFTIEITSPEFQGEKFTYLSTKKAKYKDKNKSQIEEITFVDLTRDKIKIKNKNINNNEEKTMDYSHLLENSNYQGQSAIVIAVGAYIFFEIAVSVIVTWGIYTVVESVISDDEYDWYYGEFVVDIIEQSTQKQEKYYPAWVDGYDVLIAPKAIT